MAGDELEAFAEKRHSTGAPRPRHLVAVDHPPIRILSRAEMPARRRQELEGTANGATTIAAPSRATSEYLQRGEADGQEPARSAPHGEVTSIGADG
jgi:hypothetical protein